MKFRATTEEPLVEVAVVDSLGVSHSFKPDKQGCIEVPEDFQEVTARLRDAGFESVEEEEPED